MMMAATVAGRRRCTGLSLRSKPEARQSFPAQAGGRGGCPAKEAVRERLRAAADAHHEVSGFGLRQGGGTRNRARIPIPHCGQSLSVARVRGAAAGHKSAGRGSRSDEE